MIFIPKHRLQALMRVLMMFLFFAACSDLIAQENKVVSDLGLWTEIKGKKQFLKDFHLSVSQHLRLNKNISNFDSYISEVGLIYEINKSFAIGVNGRYTRNKKKNDLFENNYRYDLHFRYERKLNKRLKLYYRIQYQKEFYGSGVFYKEINYYESQVRNRLKLRWKLNKIHRFYTSGELFRLTKKSREPYFNQYRIWIGDAVLSRIGAFDFAFGIEHQLKIENPSTNYLFKIKYEIEL